VVAVEAEAVIEVEVEAGTAEVEVAGKPVKHSCFQYDPSELSLLSRAAILPFIIIPLGV
jgi:hypothetical protein